MPVHDWAQVDRSLFHSFYLDWTSRISSRLNNGVLPSAFYALCENIRDGPRPRFVELPEPVREYRDRAHPGHRRYRGDPLPQVQFHETCTYPEYAEKAITIRA